MSETVKLIIEIPKDAYRACRPLKTDNDQGILTFCVVNAVADGIPLDDVKAEIREKSFDHYFECGEYIGEDCRKERIIYLDRVFEILDNIGKGDSE